jgi:hypothetical protein
MVSVILKPLPPIDEATIGLSLLTDLTGMLPPDIMFDFVTSGVEIGPVSGSRPHLAQLRLMVVLLRERIRLVLEFL